MIDEEFGDGMYLNLFSAVLTKHYRVTLDEYTVSGQKEQRIIDKLEPALN